MSLRFLKSLWDCEEGQTTTEYILVLMLVVMVAVKFRQKFILKIDQTTEKLFTGIEDIMME